MAESTGFSLEKVKEEVSERMDEEHDSDNFVGLLNEGVSELPDAPATAHNDEGYVDQDDERRHAAALQEAEEDGDPESTLIEDEVQPEADLRAEDDLIGEHADLFVWDDEAQEYRPKDEESARAIAALGDRLDVHRLDSETGEHAPMEYSLLSQRMTARTSPMPTGEEESPSRENEGSKDEQSREKETAPSGAAEFLAHSAVKLASAVINGAVAAIQTGASTTMAGIHAGLKKWEERKQKKYGQRPGEQAGDIAAAAQSERLNDTGEVETTSVKPGGISEKLKASAAVNQQNIAAYADEFENTIKNSLSEMAEIVGPSALEEIKSSEELQGKLNELPPESQQQFVALKERVEETISTGKQKLTDWASGDDANSFSSLYEMDQASAEQLQRRVEAISDNLDKQTDDPQKKLLSLLTDDNGKLNVGDSLRNMFSGLKSAFQSVINRLTWRATALPDSKPANAPAMG